MTSLPEGVGATALAIAAAREAESRRPDRLFDDPLAARFIAAAGGATAEPDAELGDYVAVRTRFFDEYLFEAARTCRQAVLVAAGLDSRAFRLAWPPGMRVFELDLPASLAFKEAAIGDLAPRCDRRLVAADLREDWATALVAAGFDPTRPTAWLAEGIMSYLPEADRDAMIARMAELSAPGSRLAFENAGAVLLRSSAATTPFARAYQPLRRSALPPEPLPWLASLGWEATAEPAATAWQRYGRPFPAAGGETPAWWLVARRGEA
jgi:methyltransferase (TIGR00027 family)